MSEYHRYLCKMQRIGARSGLGMKIVIRVARDSAHRKELTRVKKSNLTYLQAVVCGPLTLIPLAHKRTRKIYYYEVADANGN